jgi:colanic acid biosynthesis glycosyl transferase WcaI
LKDDPLFRITIPSKTQAYLALGRPVLMAVAGDAAELVARSGGGLTCPPEDPAALAAAVGQLCAMGRRQREEMGANGRAFYDKHLALRVGAARFEQVFQDAVEHRKSTTTSSAVVRSAGIPVHKAA